MSGRADGSRSASGETAYKYTRWNFVVVVAEATTFMTGLTCVDPVSVLPLFIHHLTESTFLVGVVTVIQRLGWMLPQLVMAAIVGHRPRRAPFLRWGPTLGRLPVVFFVAYLWSKGAGDARAVIWFMMLLYSFCSLGNGVSAIPWQDLIAKSIPPRLRGRLFGTMHFATGVIAIGVGFFVRWVLGPNGPGFPREYTILFTLMAVFFGISVGCCWLFREPIGPVLDRPQSLREIISGAVPLLRRDPAFGRLALTALLAFAVSFLTPFYMVYAKSDLGMPDSMAGVYIWTMMIGAAVFSLFWGQLSDRRGPRAVIRAGCAFVVAAPLLALSLPFFAGLGAKAVPGLPAALPYLFSVVFMLSGSSGGALWIGVTNHVLDLASPEDRPRYLALLNFFGAPGALSPLLVGWLLGFLPFVAVFAGVAICGAAAAALGWRLPAKEVSA